MKIKKILCAIPVLAVENTDSTQDAPVLTEGAYAPNQAVVLFRDSAIDTSSALKKGDLESVGANFGEMPDASSSENESLSAADEEVNILKSTLGDDFVLEDTLVSPAGGSVCCLPTTACMRIHTSPKSSSVTRTATALQLSLM